MIRSLCLDQATMDSRKKHKPKNNAIETAKTIGAKILNKVR
ncbi:DUF4256 domain-containing protein [Christiangramia forsetii]